MLILDHLELVSPYGELKRSNIITRCSKACASGIRGQPFMMIIYYYYYWHSLVICSILAQANRGLAVTFRASGPSAVYDRPLYKCIGKLGFGLIVGQMVW